MNMPPGPKIIVKVVIVIILVAGPIDLLVLRPLILDEAGLFILSHLSPRSPIGIALPETILKTKSLLTAISFFLSTISCYNGLDAVVEEPRGLRRL